MNPSALPTATQFSSPNKLIVSLDVATADEALGLVGLLRSEVNKFKIGLQLFTAAGPDLVRRLAFDGYDIFLDLKFHDIPNTVASAGIEAARLGVWMFNVHASGGPAMMSECAGRVKEACNSEGLRVPKMVAVTVLTSTEIGTVDRGENGLVVRLAQAAFSSNMDGVVSSGHEAAQIRKAIAGTNFCIVTPGIRPAFATNDDQKRVMTPSEAVAAGADYLVVGRPIITAADPRQAARNILESMSVSNEKQ